MSILLPYNVSPNLDNKYLYYFWKSIKDENIDIISSTNSWINKSKRYEAVIIHWPEYLPLSRKLSEFEFLRFTIHRLNYFKKFSKIIYFVHNEKPHNSLKRIEKKLYEAVVYNSDLIFHFNQFSKDLFNLKYKLNKKQFVLSHGNYLKLDNKKSEKIQLYEDLKLIKKKKIVTTIGAIRNKGEFDLLYNFSREYLKEDCHFIYVGELAQDFHNLESSGRFIEKLINLIFKEFRLKNFIKKYRIFRLKRFSKNIRVFSNRIPDNLLVEICKLSDILLIVRNESLNSGNISLGFSFGCYVVGPDIGNIGNILKENNNFVYNIKDIKYNHIVSKSIENLNSNIIENNRRTAIYNWDWRKLSKEFKEILLSIDIK